MKRARLDDALRDFITGIDYRQTLMSKQTQLEELYLPFSDKISL